MIRDQSALKKIGWEQIYGHWFKMKDSNLDPNDLSNWITHKPCYRSLSERVSDYDVNSRRLKP